MSVKGRNIGCVGKANSIAYQGNLDSNRVMAGIFDILYATYHRGQYFDGLNFDLYDRYE